MAHVVLLRGATRNFIWSALWRAYWCVRGVCVCVWCVCVVRVGVDVKGVFVGV